MGIGSAHLYLLIVEEDGGFAMRLLRHVPGLVPTGHDDLAKSHPEQGELDSTTTS
jgi:hypothetical protein